MQHDDQIPDLDNLNEYESVILGALPLGICVIKRDGSLPYANQAYLDQLGLSLQDLRERPYWDPRWQAINVEGKPFTKDHYPIFVAFQTGQRSKTQLGFLHEPSQSYRWLEFEAIPVFHQDEESPYQVIIMVQDYIEPSLMPSIQLEQERFKALSESSSAVFFRVDIKDGEPLFRYISQNIEQISGYTVERLLQEQDLIYEAILHPRDQAWLIHIRELEAVPQVIPGRWHHQDGHTIWMEHHLSPYYVRGQMRGFDGIAYDVSAQREAEKALLENQRVLERLINHLPGSVYSSNPAVEGSPIYFSDELERISGYTREEFILKKISWLSLILEEERTHIQAETAKAINLKESWNLKYPIRTKSGAVKWILDKGQGVYEDDQLLFIEGFAQDITESRQFEQALIESERLLTSLFNNLQNMVYRALNDEHYSALMVNAVAYDMTGYKAEEFLSGKVHYAELIHPNDLERVVEHLSGALSRRERFEVEYRIINRQKEIRWMWERGSGVYDQDGQVIAIEGVISDITEQKRDKAELILSRANLLEKEQMLSNIFNNIDGAIYRLQFFENRITKILTMSPGIKKLTGYSAEELIIGDITLRDMIKAPEHLQEVLQIIDAVLEKKVQEVEFEVAITIRNGEIRWILNRGVLNYLDNGDIIANIVIVDITDRKLAEQSLAESRLQLAKNERLLTHIFNNLYGVVYRSLILDDGTLKTEVLSEGVQELLDYSVQDFLEGRIDWPQLIHPEDRDRVEKCIEQGIRTQERFEIEFRMVSKTGEVKWILNRASFSQEGDQFILDGISLDITARKLANEQIRIREEELSDYKAVLSSMLSNLPGIIFRMRVSEPSQIMWINEGIEEITGYGVEEIVSGQVKWLDVVHPDDRERVNGLLQKAIAERGSYDYEYRFVSKAGQIGWLMGRGSCSQIGDVVYLDGFDLDISKRKEIENRLSQSTNIYHHSFDYGSIPKAHISIEGRFTRVNTKLCNLLDYSESELLSKHLVDVTHPDDREQDVNILRRMRRALLTSMVYEKRFLNRDGTTIWVQMSLTRVESEGDEEIFFIANMADISERVEAQEKLHALNMDLEQRILERTRDLSKSQNRFKAIVENQQELVNRYTSDTTLTFINEAYGRFFGYDEKKVIGIKWIDLLPEEERDTASAMVANLLAHPESSPYIWEREILNNKGEKRWYRWTETLIDNYDGSYEIQGVGIDITEIKEAYFQLAQALETSEEAGRLKSHFVSMVSHEFRTPLSIIRSSTELIEAWYEKLHGEDPPPNIHKHVERIISTIDRLVNLLNEVIFVGQYDSGKLAMRFELYDIDRLLEAILEQLREGKGKAYEITLESDAPGKHDVYIDVDLMWQGLSNLIGNAIKYSHEGGHIRIKVSQETDGIAISIQDEGIGIPESEISKLFHMFYRASNVGGIRGSGLGLIITKRIIESHEGSITLESKVGTGSCFYIHLPSKETFLSLKPLGDPPDA